MLTIADLENGRDFWLWAKNHLECYDKSDWPDVDRLNDYLCQCPFCEEYNRNCKGCPLKEKISNYCYAQNEVFKVWEESEDDTKRLQAIEIILAVYQEEIKKKEKKMDTKLNEPILQDNYPIFWGYLYVANGEVVVKSDIKGTVNDLKRDLNQQGILCREIRRCDIIGRQKLLRKKEGEK